MATPRLPRARAFISYSHRDRAYLDRLHTHLKAALRDQPLDIWDDTQIKPGERWRDKIEQALVTARVAVVLVSPDFLASDFITQNELPPLLAAAEREGAVILPVILDHCLFEESALAQYQGINAPSEPLSEMNDSARNLVWVKLTRRIREILTAPQPLGTTLFTRNQGLGVVQALAWSPDSKRLVAATNGTLLQSDGARFYTTDGKLTIWDAISGQSLFTQSFFLDSARALAWSPDGRYIAMPSRRVDVWDTLASKSSLIYQGHTEEVISVAWSPDGRYIASGGFDKTLRVWGAASGQDTFSYNGHRDVIMSIAWSPDGKHWVSGSKDATVQVWGAKGTLARYTEHTKGVTSVAWSPDGGRIASGSWDGTVQVWDAMKAKRLLAYMVHTREVHAVAWSPDSKRVASACDDGTVQIWDATTGQNLYSYIAHHSSVLAVAWSPDGKRLASADWHTVVHVWSAG